MKKLTVTLLMMALILPGISQNYQHAYYTSQKKSKERLKVSIINVDKNSEIVYYPEFNEKIEIELDHYTTYKFKIKNPHPVLLPDNIQIHTGSIIEGRLEEHGPYSFIIIFKDPKQHEKLIYPDRLLAEMADKDKPSLKASLNEVTDSLEGKGENPVTTAKTARDSLYFTVQVGYFKDDISVSYFDNLYGVNAIKDKKGSTVYQVGKFAKYNDAIPLLEQVQRKGYHDAFIAAYKNGNRMPVIKARNLTSIK